MWGGGGGKLNLPSCKAWWCWWWWLLVILSPVMKASLVWDQDTQSQSQCPESRTLGKNAVLPLERQAFAVVNAAQGQLREIRQGQVVDGHAEQRWYGGFFGSAAAAVSWEAL